MIKEAYKYSALTEKVIGCAMRVHSKLGSGFQEVIYQRALALEMAAQKIIFGARSVEFRRVTNTKL